jgi:cation transport regulator
MPYPTNSDLPKQLQGLPAEAQTIFRSAFNAAFKESGEEAARKIAWSAVKKVFEKKGDKWVKKQTIQSFVNITTRVQAFTQDEIIARIPNDVLERIREKDEHPFFQMYSVAHEGIAEPEIEGQGHSVVKWFKAAIQSIKKVFKNGIKFFDGHNTTNDIQDRPELGETIHAFEEEIDGALNYCVIGYFPPETRERAKQMDVCSQEAQWTLIKDVGCLIAETCTKFTGIALGNSQHDTPAFKNAKRLAFVQAFDKSPPGEGESGDDSQEKIMTFQEIKEACKKLNVMPHQLYSSEEIKADREFGKVFEEINNLNEQLKNKESEIQKYINENKELNRKNSLQSAKGILSKIYKDNNLTNNITKFVDDIYEETKDNLSDLSEEKLQEFVNKQVKIFQKATGLSNQQQEENDQQIPNGDQANNQNENPFVDDVNEDDYI